LPDDGRLASLEKQLSEARAALAETAKNQIDSETRAEALADALSEEKSEGDMGEHMRRITVAALKEAEAALAERDALSDRIITIADEGTGLHPVQSPDDALTRIERALFGYRAALAEKDAALREARRLLFLNHGCFGPALYGDDGEMQDSACGIDFARDGMAFIEKRWTEKARRALSEHPPAPAPKEGHEHRCPCGVQFHIFAEGDMTEAEEPDISPEPKDEGPPECLGCGARSDGGYIVVNWCPAHNPFGPPAPKEGKP